MTRPLPRVLLQHTEDHTRVLQVCDADALYAVCYKGRPIMVKHYADINSNFVNAKYAKTSFPNPGHAFNLADRLNEKFATTDFSVVLMQVGRTVYEK